MKNKTEYKVVYHRHGYSRPESREIVGTVESLTQYFSYTLECGRSWEGHRGCKKISLHPRGIESLIKNINNAFDNCACNGCSAEWLELIGEI